MGLGVGRRKAEVKNNLGSFVLERRGEDKETQGQRHGGKKREEGGRERQTDSRSE